MRGYVSLCLRIWLWVWMFHVCEFFFLLLLHHHHFLVCRQLYRIEYSPVGSSLLFLYCVITITITFLCFFSTVAVAHLIIQSVGLLWRLIMIAGPPQLISPDFCCLSCGMVQIFVSNGQYFLVNSPLVLILLVLLLFQYLLPNKDNPRSTSCRITH